MKENNKKKVIKRWREKWIDERLKEINVSI